MFYKFNSDKIKKELDSSNSFLIFKALQDGLEPTTP